MEDSRILGLDSNLAGLNLTVFGLVVIPKGGRTSLVGGGMNLLVPIKSS